MDNRLEVLYENEDLIAINKPHGLLVHRTKMAADATEFAVQILREQIGQRVYPPHRLDRKTSGVLIFAKSNAVNSQLMRLFRESKVLKIYKAIVRGFVPDNGLIDYDLKKDNKVQDAQTAYKCLKQFEIPVPLGQFETSRYSLVELYPITGRFHQLRKHMAHIHHPIIGDRPHGCNKQNRMWKEKFQMTTMLLHAASIRFNFPEGNSITITADLSAEFKRILQLLEVQNVHDNPES